MATDILCNEMGDIACVNGDFVIGESFDQEVEDILLANPGDYKETPLIGPGLIRRLKGKASIESIRRDVAISLELDNKTLENLSITENKTLNVKVK